MRFSGFCCCYSVSHCSNKPTIKIIDWSFLCQWANVQNQQGIKTFFPHCKIIDFFVAGGWRGTNFKLWFLFHFDSVPNSQDVSAWHRKCYLWVGYYVLYYNTTTNPTSCNQVWKSSCQPYALDTAVRPSNVFTMILRFFFHWSPWQLQAYIYVASKAWSLFIPQHRKVCVFGATFYLSTHCILHIFISSLSLHTVCHCYAFLLFLLHSV